MFSGRKNSIRGLVLIGLIISSHSVCAAEFEPGVGIGVEYTDNAQLTADTPINDVIAATYVGAKISDNKEAIKYDIAASLNNYIYTQNSFADQRYLNLTATTDWEMIKDRFGWFLTDSFSQRPIVSLNSNTPANLQDSNIFTVGANINQPVSARQQFSLVPMFSQYYYEVLPTDNRQYSLVASWNYQLFRLTGIGLNLSTRNINYTEQLISDTRFSNIALLINGQRKSTSFSISLGSTSVSRTGDPGTSEFSGYLNWTTDLSSRSKFKTTLSSELTDTSSVALNDTNTPGNGNGDDVQITTDVVRNSVVNLAYLREDAGLNTNVWMKYNKLTYSDNPLDRVIRAFGLQGDYPVSTVLSSGAYIIYNRTKQLDSGRLDKRYTVGGNLKYNFSRKVHGLLDFKYRKKESNSVTENYDEFSVFVSLVYGFGDVSRPTRAGGF